MSKNDSDREVFEQYAELVKRFKAGDESAFTEIYEKSKRLVYATCYGILNNKEDAEDAMQETYINLYNKIGTLEDDKSFLEWLKRMASNKALDKRKSIKDESSFDEVVEGKDYSDEDIDLEHLPESLIMEKDKRDTFYKIMRNELSDAQFQTIFLHYYDELPLVDIADLMNCSIETVRSRLKSARAKLKSGIQEYEITNKVSLLGAAGTGTLGKFFGSYYGSLKVPAVKPFPAKIASVPKALGTGKAAAGKAAATAAAKAEGAASLPKILGIVGASVLGLGVVGGGIYMLNNQKEDNVIITNYDVDETEASSVVIETSETSETKAEPAVKERTVTVTEGYGEDTTAVGGNPDYPLTLEYRKSIPQVNISDKDMTAVNEKIRSDIEEKLGSRTYIVEIGYMYFIGDETVSIVVKFDDGLLFGEDQADTYLIYNVSVETGELLKPEEFINLCGLTDEEFFELADASFATISNDYYNRTSETDNEYQYVISEDFYNSVYEKNKELISYENFTPFFSSDGHLCFEGVMWTFGGASQENLIVDTEIKEYIYKFTPADVT